MNAPEAASARADAWLSPSTQRLVDDAVTALEPVRQALLASDHRVYNSPSSRGVLMVSVHGGVNSTANIAPHDEPECVAALRSLRRQAARHHVTLAADNITLLQLEQLGALRLWDSHIMLHPQEAERALLSDARWRANAQELQLWKLIALAASPYQETVFIDNDILVLSHTLVSDLLDHSLHVSDLAFVQDPARPRSEARERVNLASARLRGRIVTSPLMYARGVPPLCTCVMAYRRTPSVRQLLHRATARHFLRLNTLDVSTPSTPTHIRQGDQEMIWFQLVTGSGPTRFFACSCSRRSTTALPFTLRRARPRRRTTTSSRPSLEARRHIGSPAGGNTPATLYTSITRTSTLVTLFLDSMTRPSKRLRLRSAARRGDEFE